ncbi:forkhead box protein N1 [Anguilla rostrata]|uniref:forkhead box protein N1 n=1 Tax=Anguilla rostrata TaxID=7938 RepID=UPI0030D1C354
MSAEPSGPPVSPGASRTPPVPPQVDSEPQVSPPLQMEPSQHVKTSIREGSAAFPVRDSAPHRLKDSPEERGRRHSADGATTDEGRGHFHPYQRQYSDGAKPRLPPPYPQPQPRPSPHPPHPVCFQGMDQPESLPAAHTHPDQGGQQRAWDPYRECIRPSRGRGAQPKYPESHSHIHGAYTSQHSLQQFPAGMFSAVGQSGYSLQCLPQREPFRTGHKHGHTNLHTLYTQTHYSITCKNIHLHNHTHNMKLTYPKPIYSYNILIFMALRSSRTGSLPVSEIYGFMTEHFPYFKTAPDGWKNSVRHNLSLNKCFEKVENRSGGGAGGGASRKGCLWALNPARVEKMQEELHKWRRKDPLTVRKSMARPEELGRLLGENTDGLRPVPSHFACPSHLQGPAHLATPGQTPPPRGRASFDPPPSFGHSQPGAPGYAFGHSHQSQAPPPFSYPSSGIPQEAGGALESPLAAQTPLYSAALQAHHCRPRTMQELLMDGELCSDTDTLNPTLTDLQLQGNLWEELRNDSLAPDSLQLVPTSASPAPPNHAGTLSPCCP